MGRGTTSNRAVVPIHFVCMDWRHMTELLKYPRSRHELVFASSLAALPISTASSLGNTGAIVREPSGYVRTSAGERLMALAEALEQGVLACQATVSAKRPWRGRWWSLRRRPSQTSLCCGIFPRSEQHTQHYASNCVGPSGRSSCRSARQILRCGWRGRTNSICARDGSRALTLDFTRLRPGSSQFGSPREFGRPQKLRCDRLGR